MDIECPYCEKELDICHDDGFGYAEGVKHKIECPHCKKQFVFETSILFYYASVKADCLNGDKHDYQLTYTYPKEFSKMRCSVCDATRDLTGEERIKYNIENKKNESF